jgi:hypothetical protein
MTTHKEKGERGRNLGYKIYIGKEKKRNYAEFLSLEMQSRTASRCIEEGH